MVEEHKCRWKDREGEEHECPRIATHDNGTRCIFHAEEKDAIEFNASLEELVWEWIEESADSWNLVGFVFPARISATDITSERTEHGDPVFPVKTSFNRATFSGSADFNTTMFSESVDFSRTTFIGKASFIGAVFSSEASFASAVFRDKVLFYWSGFNRVNLSEVDLRNAEFGRAELQHVDLRRATLSNVGFRWAELKHVDLRGANIEGIDLTETKIENVRVFAQDLAKAKIRPEQLSGFDVEEIPDETEARELIRHPKGLLQVELNAEEPSVIALMQLFLNYERTYDLLYALFFAQYTDAEEYFRLILSPYSLAPEQFRLRIKRIQYGSPFGIEFLADANIIEILTTSGVVIAALKWITPQGLKDAVETRKAWHEGTLAKQQARKEKRDLEEAAKKEQIEKEKSALPVPYSEMNEGIEFVRDIVSLSDFKADDRIVELVKETLAKLPKEYASQKDPEKLAKFTQLFLEELAKSNENLPETLRIKSVKAQDTGEEL